MLTVYVNSCSQLRCTYALHCAHGHHKCFDFVSDAESTCRGHLLNEREVCVLFPCNMGGEGQLDQVMQLYCSVLHHIHNLPELGYTLLQPQGMLVAM